MPVLIGEYEIRPAPQVSITKAPNVTGDGRRLSSTITARLTGTLVTEKTGDTYAPVSIEHKLAVLLEKQEEIRAAFNQNGLMFQVQGFDGTPPVQFPAIVDSIDFGEGGWTEKADYTITLHGPDFEDEKADDDSDCETASESWSFEEGELARTWKATHTVSAKGKLVYDLVGSIPLLPWQIAKAFVTNKLGLDWNTAAAPDWSSLSGSALAGGSAAIPKTVTQWNRTVNETVDESEGTYSVNETWILNDNPYVEDYTVSVRRVDEPNVTSQASISGSIRGLSATFGDYEGRYAAALARWDTVKTLLVTRCQEAAASTLSTHPTAANVDHNRFEGSVSYSYEYNDRVIVNDTFETYTITKSTSLEEYKTSVRIDGTITGQVYLDAGASTTIKYQRAQAQWEMVKGLIFARAVTESEVPGLKAFPTTASVTSDATAGTISYTYEFDDRNPSNVRHEPTVSRRFDRAEGYTNIVVEGTVTGLRVANASDPFGHGSPEERYEEALTYYQGISGNLLGIAAQYESVGEVNPNPSNTTVGHSPLAGSISYSATFTSQIAPVTPGALTESVTVVDDDGVQVVALIPVPGLADGPVFQDIQTKEVKRRQVTAEIVMVPPNYGSPAPPAKPTFDVGPYVPDATSIRTVQDQTSWVVQQGRYTRTVSWEYK